MSDHMVPCPDWDSRSLSQGLSNVPIGTKANQREHLRQRPLQPEGPLHFCNRAAMGLP